MTTLHCFDVVTELDGTVQVLKGECKGITVDSLRRHNTLTEFNAKSHEIQSLQTNRCDARDSERRMATLCVVKAVENKLSHPMFVFGTELNKTRRAAEFVGYRKGDENVKKMKHMVHSGIYIAEIYPTIFTAATVQYAGICI